MCNQHLGIYLQDLGLPAEQDLELQAYLNNYKNQRCFIKNEIKQEKITPYPQASHLFLDFCSHKEKY